MVSAGAEVIADGSIPRLCPVAWPRLAGASGDKSARIFTTSLEARTGFRGRPVSHLRAGVPADLARQPATVSLSGDGGDRPRLTVAPLALGKPFPILPREPP